MSEPNPVDAAPVRPLKLSHGTLTCRDLDASRRFLEGFLGLDCVRHEKQAMIASHGRQWAIVCIQVGDKAEGSRSALHHYGIDVATPEEVDHAHRVALERQRDYELQRVMSVNRQHGTYGFYLQDRDGNWWEIQYAGHADYATLYARGDISGAASSPPPPTLPPAAPDTAP